MSTIGIKVKEPVFNAKIAKIARKYENISISETKNRVISNNLLFSCDYIDAEGINKVISLYNELLDERIDAILIENDEITTIDFLDNLLESYNETEAQVENEIDMEAYCHGHRING